MPASGLGAAGILQGLPDYLRQVTAEIVLENAVIASWLGGRFYQANAVEPLRETGIPHGIVALSSVDPDNRVGGVSDLVALTTLYVFDVFRRPIVGPETSIGGVWDEHLLHMGEGQNARLFRPGLQFVEQLVDFEAVVMAQPLDEDALEVRVNLAITANYRLSGGARQRFRYGLENP